MSKMLESFVLAAGKVMMVVDESSYIATHNATRSEECVRIGLQTEYRLAMTGTPLRDGPLNLFMQFEFLDSNIIGIGDYYAFRNRYAVMGGYRDPKSGRPMQVVGYQNLDELAQTISPYVFQISKEEAKKMLPEKHPQRRVIPMMKEQRELYDQIKRENFFAVDDEEQVMQTVLETCLRLHQVCGGHKVKAREFERTVKGEKRIQRVYDPLPVMPWDKNPKIIELGDILDECDDVAVVWCAYKPEIEAVKNLLSTRIEPERIAFYHGGVSTEDRDEYDKGFKSGKYKYMLSNQMTGGMGLTWIEPELVVYFSNTNKMIDRVQSEERTHRRGLQHAVTYIDLLMEKSIDLTIEHSIKNKMDLAAYVESRIKDASALKKNRQDQKRRIRNRARHGTALPPGQRRSLRLLGGALIVIGIFLAFSGFGASGTISTVLNLVWGFTLAGYGVRMLLRSLATDRA
jgi:SNF2 family DNA or RNA helicase